MASTSTSSNGPSLPVVFSTQTPYRLPSQKFMIPASWKRYQLSQLVNKALSLAQPVPFDFLVRGEILRSTLAEWCADNGVGEEETLEIEYIESVLPPQKMSEFPHDDWVSCVSCKLPGHFITSSYDGHIRSFDYSKTMTSSALMHHAPITSFCLLSTPTSTDAQTVTVATASHDLTGQISQLTLSGTSGTDLTETSSTRKTRSSAKPLATLHLHTAPLSSISTNHDSSRLLTASWDHLVGLWDTTIPDSDEVPEDAPVEGGRRTKRRKVDGEGAVRKAPLIVLKSHTGRVSRAIFGTAGGSDSMAYSCGFDSTVRTWDTETGLCTRTVTASEKPFLSLATVETGSAVLALSTDRTMSLYDMSSSSALASASFLHPATPSCIALGRGSSTSQQVVTGAYDGLVRVWDLRSTKGAVASFKGWDGGKKVLGVDWDTGASVEGRKGIAGVAGEGGLEVWRVGRIEGEEGAAKG